MSDRRSTDAEGADYAGLRVPKRWKAWVGSAALTLGAAVGTYFATKEGLIDKDPHGGRAVDMALQTLTDLKVSVDNLNATLAMVNSERGAGLELARETRAEIGRLARKVSVEENAVERHNEVMAYLDAFDKKGVKRR